MTTALTTTNGTGGGGTGGAIVPARAEQSASILETALIRGDLSKLSAEDRMIYYRQVCESAGLNPLTRPFDFLTDKSGKMILYARKDCSEQLRKIHTVSLEILKNEVVDEYVIVHVRATMPVGTSGQVRTDEDYGLVHIGKGTGEYRVNAILKAVTKAKRRVTLSICGLGFLDETEVEDTRDLRRVDAPQGQQVQAPIPQPAPQQPPSAPPGAEMVTNKQLAELRRLKDILLIPGEKWSQIVAKRGVTTAKDLTARAADELILKLQTMPVPPRPEALPSPVQRNELVVEVPAVGKGKRKEGGEPAEAPGKFPTVTPW